MPNKKANRPHDTQNTRKQESQKVDKGPYHQHAPYRARRLLELLHIAAIGDDLRFPWGADVKAPVLVVVDIKSAPYAKHTTSRKKLA
jgi:hypothetical protein